MKKTALQLLKDELVGETPPEGWYTMDQLMEMLDARRNIVNTLVVRKKYANKKFRCLSKDGKLMLIKHYNIGKL